MGLLGKSFKDVAPPGSTERTKPYWGRITTTGSVSDPVSMGQFVNYNHIYKAAESQEQIDPQEGPENVFWDIKIRAKNRPPITLATGLTYHEMLRRMTAYEAEGAGKANVVYSDKDLAAFVEERRSAVPKSNVLRLLPAPGK